MSQGRAGVGVIGAGVISRYYLENLVRFPDLNVVAIADLDASRAMARAGEFGIAAMAVDEILARADIEIILNLTVPAAHFEVSMRILANGKHVWSEKPIAVNRQQAQTLMEEAEHRGLRVACAPDTILGAGLQTAQREIASGLIGEPKSALAIVQSPGPEGVHPQPAFYYGKGAGALLDMGPYYVAALVQNLGAVRRVSAVASTALPRRRIRVGPAAGTEFEVHVPSQHMALFEFASGARATMVASFDSGIRHDRLEFHGTEGTVEVPNPNRFAGTARFTPFHEASRDIPAVGSTWERGVGVLDLARSLRNGEPERASGQLAFHVLDVLLSIEEAASTGQPVQLKSTADSPLALSESWDPTEETPAAPTH